MTLKKLVVWKISLLLGAWCLMLPVHAYPPGPYHLIYGTVRDQYGTPLTIPSGQVLLQTPSGAQFAAPIVPGITSIPGVNFLMKVPLDSGVTPDLYQPGVLVPGAAFKLLVVIGTVTNVPIQIATNYLSLGQWAKTTRIDLTLGVDSNGDGIPDAWEYAFLSIIGSNVPLSQLNSNSILTGDGLTLWQEFILGTAIFDPDEPLDIVFVGFTNASPILQFPVVNGRSYTIISSPTLERPFRIWTPVSFNLASEGLGPPTHSFYFASSVATMQFYLVPPPPGTTAQFYRVLVQ